MTTVEKVEPECLYTTYERKYYQRGGSFIKRSLRPHEYKQGLYGICTPRLSKERLQNEADCLRFVQQNAKIPVPRIHADFEDDGAYYVVAEFVDGVELAEIPEEKKGLALQELQQHLAVLHTLRSNILGGSTGLVVIPARLMTETKQDVWTLKPSEIEEYVFCHKDISEHNVMVDPETYLIKAIVDWEYAGFYPKFFEAPVYTKSGPKKQLLNDDPDNVTRMLDFLRAREVQAGLQRVTGCEVNLTDKIVHELPGGLGHKATPEDDNGEKLAM